MKKSYNPISDVRNESVDLTKRLCRNIFDAVHNLDDIRGRAGSVSDLFTHQAEAQRVRLREYCERLMFSDPTAHGRKAEELLWRKGYYEVIYTAKRLRKVAASSNRDGAGTWVPEEMVLVHNHVTAGIGQYHHLLSRLQFDRGLNLKGVVDYHATFHDEGLKKGKGHHQGTAAVTVALNGGGNGGFRPPGSCEEEEWARDAAHRCLIYLGDLCRYLLSLQPGWDFGLPAHYYIQALMWKPEAGMPHNQLGTLSAGQNYSLDAVYHYMRCLCCPQTFEGTEGNLTSTLDKTARWLESGGGAGVSEANVLNRTVSRLLYLTRNWFCNRPVQQPLHKVCDELLNDLKECLQQAACDPEKEADEPEDLEVFVLQGVGVGGKGGGRGDGSPTRLTEDMLFKIVAIVLMCLHNLEKKGSDELMRATALQLTLISQILQQALLKVESVLAPPATPPLPDSASAGDSKQGLRRSRRRRRRRRRRRGSSEEGLSDLSEGDDVVVYNMSSNSDSNISEEEQLVFDERMSDTDDEQLLPNGKAARNGGVAKTAVEEEEEGKEKLPSDYRENPTFQHLHKLSQEGFLLQTIKICFDWLGQSCNIEMIRSCSQACKPLIGRAAAFLNHLIQVPVPLRSEKANQEEEATTDGQNCRITLPCDMEKLPLPEDLCLRSLPALADAQAGLAWDTSRHRTLASDEEMYLRLCRMLTIGMKLAQVESTGLSYSSDRRWFSSSPVNNCSEQKDGDKLAKALAATTAPAVNSGVSGMGNGNSVVIAANNHQKQENNGGGSLNTPANSVKQDKLMQDMGQLWLRAEVKELETKVKRTAQHLPPYLVLDCEALTLHSPLVKQLVSARKFIVLIPSVVVSALDEQKRASGRVRDTIRWLEGQFRHGNRFVRAQRPNEHLPLPLIKYPKKKDKEAWLFFQVVECCHFLSNQGGGGGGGGGGGKDAVTLVTLLTGSPTLLTSSNNTGFSPLGIVKSAGINIEHIESFHSKWKSSCKSHG